ncbi:MAG: hypothetical protein WCA16_15000 [Candidatus Sulfotelmatobacter sp.]
MPDAGTVLINGERVSLDLQIAEGGGGNLEVSIGSATCRRGVTPNLDDLSTGKTLPISWL